MERSESLSSLTYKGSIPEAILEAKNQKKLFVVYVSGEDDDSKNLENSTWTDLKVKDSLSKYCILLHIQGGSTDAANFSAIYPQNSVPCITAIGYNGVQVWQNEGFVSAEVLASSLEKAWLSLHIQETTATVLSAALASKKYEPSTSGPSIVNLPQQESSSSASVPSGTTDEAVHSLDKPAVSSGGIEENSVSEDAIKGKNPELIDKGSSESFHSNNLARAAEQCDASTEPSREPFSSVITGPANSISENTSSHPEDGFVRPVKGIIHHSDVPTGSCSMSSAEAEKTKLHEKDKGIDDGEVDASANSSAANMPTDALLNIRLPDGSSLQVKFPVADTLRMVKDYVDKNQSSGLGSYDLAIPYPRKIFGDQDLSKSLMDLGLLNRQALIVVPRQKSTGFKALRSFDQTNSTPTEVSTGSNGGYFTYIKSFLSYINPFSYLGGGATSSNTGQESQSGFWEYGPNSSLQNSLAGRNRSYSSSSPNRSTSTARDDSTNRRPTTSRYGSNVHTLRHDEDDSRFADRNSFWNGNSTQYGGNSDSK